VRALAVDDPDALLMLKQQLDLCLGPNTVMEPRAPCGATDISNLGQDVVAAISRIDDPERRRQATLQWLEIEWQFAESRRDGFIEGLQLQNAGGADRATAESSQSQPLWKLSVDVQNAREKLERFITTTSSHDPAAKALLMRLRAHARLSANSGSGLATR
jgi:hypothetical protein